MSEFGEKADMILELLSKEKTMTVEELKKEISIEDAALLRFMHHVELIEIKNGKASLKDFGAGIISAE
jgi:hypothetical protein